jgi:hypothetical protein
MESFAQERAQAFQAARDKEELEAVSRAERRQRAERRLAKELAEKRRNLPSVDWKAMSARWKLEDSDLINLSAPRHQFDENALFGRLIPHGCDLVRSLMAYERSVVTGYTKAKALAHCHRAFEPVLTWIVPVIPKQDPLPPEVQRVRLSDGIHAGPFELLFDEHGQYIGLRAAPYAEHHGVFESSAMGEFWGLLRIASLRIKAWHALIETLQAETLHIVTDRRTRAQMVEDCHLAHSVRDVEICRFSQVRTEEFYRWRKDKRVRGRNRINNSSDRHRRIVRVLCSPIWPPVVEWPVAEE